MPIRDGAQHIFGFCRATPVRLRRPERLFFACFPDQTSAGQIYRFGQMFMRNHHLGGRSLLPERLHVSLHHVGDFGWLPAGILHAAETAGSAVRMPPFEMTFRSIRSFGARPPRTGSVGARPLVLLGEGAGPLELHRQLAAAMMDHGLRPSPAIVPHMTFAYGSVQASAREIDPIKIVFDSFRLVHSERGQTRYHMLGAWRLDASAASAIDLNLA